MVFGGGHAATLTVRAAKKNLVKPTAIAAVAPTWAGPLPIVFGRDSSMETRYSESHLTLMWKMFFWSENAMHALKNFCMLNVKSMLCRVIQSKLPGCL